jgi:hypothetical protein
MAGRPIRREKVIERELEGELVLHDPDTERTVLLNPVSAAIWDLCDGEHTVEEIARCVAEHFRGAVEGQVLEDTIEAVERLQSEGVLMT